MADAQGAEDDGLWIGSSAEAAIEAKAIEQSAPVFMAPQAPSPLHEPEPHEPSSSAHSSSGSRPSLMGAQAPLIVPVSAALQAEQAPSQRTSQQTPSTQKPLPQPALSSLLQKVHTCHLLGRKI